MRFTPPPQVLPYGEDTLPRVWTDMTRAAFVQGLQRVREGEWHNEWERYFAGGRARREDEPRLSDSDDAEMTAFDEHMWHYCIAQRQYQSEVRAYRTLQSFQGTAIPRFYAPVSFPTGDPEPLLSIVHGVAIEYIDGVTLEHFRLGENITPEQAERVTQGTLQVVRGIRDLGLLHEDLAFRNLMLRRASNGDFHYDNPVIIDFGMSYGFNPDEDEATQFIADLTKSVARARDLFERTSWHIPSVWLTKCAPDPFCGYEGPNRYIEGMSAERRERFFEEIPKSKREAPRKVVDEEDGEVYIYEPARWRVREGVKGQDADWEWQHKAFTALKDEIM